MIFVLAIFISAYVVYFLILTLTRAGETSVLIRVVPDDAKVTINGKPVTPGAIYVTPGRYTLMGFKNGFKTDTEIVQVGKDEVVVGLTPIPESDEAKQWLADNPKVQLEREALGSANANRRGEEIAKSFPIVSILPYEDIYGPFQIDYGPSNTQPNGVLLVVSNSTPPGRAKALEWIRQQGQDPTDLEIRYTDFTNPLVTGVVGE